MRRSASARAGFGAGPLRARPVQPEDLDFVLDLMADPRMNAHKPDPTPPTPDAIVATHAGDLLQWDRLEFGRYVLSQGQSPVGLCGLRPRPGWPGLNLSYHLAPAAWGKGWATLVARGLVGVARGLVPQPPSLHGLARPGNPASGRVLEKAGFTHTGSIELGGAPTDVYTFDLSKPWLKGTA